MDNKVTMKYSDRQQTVNAHPASFGRGRVRDIISQRTRNSVYDFASRCIENKPAVG